MQDMNMSLMQTYLALNYGNVYMKDSYRIKIIVHILKESFWTFVWRTTLENCFIWFLQDIAFIIYVYICGTDSLKITF